MAEHVGLKKTLGNSDREPGNRAKRRGRFAKEWRCAVMSRYRSERCRHEWLGSAFGAERQDLRLTLGQQYGIVPTRRRRQASGSGRRIGTDSCFLAIERINP